LLCDPVGLYVGVHVCLSSDFAADALPGREPATRIVGVNFFQGKRNPPSRQGASELPGSPPASAHHHNPTRKRGQNRISRSSRMSLPTRRAMMARLRVAVAFLAYASGGRSGHNPG
jgi:hypothetical protein